MNVSIKDMKNTITNDKLKSYFINRFNFFKKHCNFFNKFYKINMNTDDFNRCSCKDGLCALGTQCKVSALVFNYVFGEPTIDIKTKSVEEMMDLIKNIPNNSYIHFMLAVNSIDEFVGHRLIIFALKENEKITIFKIQSYVNSYTTRVDEITIDECSTQMKTFIQLFQRPDLNTECSKTTPEDCKFWESFAFDKLEVGIDIPTDIHVFNYYQSGSDLDQPKNFIELKRRIRNRMNELIDNPLQLIENYKEQTNMLRQTFGIESTLNQNEMESIITTVKKLSKEFKDYDQKYQQQKPLQNNQYHLHTLFGNSNQQEIQPLTTITPQNTTNQPSITQSNTSKQQFASKTKIQPSITQSNTSKQSASKTKIQPSTTITPLKQVKKENVTLKQKINHDRI